MEPLDYVENLARLARQESVPDISVQGVLARVRKGEKTTLLPLWIYAGWLTPTAAAMLFFTARVWTSLSCWMSSVYWAGPLDGFLSPLRLVMP
jgi:hypothetical protein